jgi:hypothetical protein
MRVKLAMAECSAKTNSDTSAHGKALTLPNEFSN